MLLALLRLREAAEEDGGKEDLAGPPRAAALAAGEAESSAARASAAAAASLYSGSCTHRLDLDSAAMKPSFKGASAGMSTDGSDDVTDDVSSKSCAGADKDETVDEGESMANNVDRDNETWGCYNTTVCRKQRIVCTGF